MITTPPAIIQRIDSVLAAGNANNPAQVQSNFAPDATIVDEIPPILWTGPSAGARWWHSVQRFLAKSGGGTMSVRHGAVEECVLDREGDDAYVIVPLRVTVSAHGKSNTERGQWVLTLHRTGATWLISTATWTTTF